MSARDVAAVEAFANFLSWGEVPCGKLETANLPMMSLPRAVPPAWWAYALGYTSHCPPKDEL
jgi:hypothetical protein